MPKCPYSPALSARLPPERRGGHSEHGLYTPQIALWVYFSPSTTHSSLWGTTQKIRIRCNLSVPHFPACTKPPAPLQMCRPGRSNPRAGQGGAMGTRYLGSRAEPSRGRRQVGKPGVGPCWSRGVILGEILPLASLRSPQHVSPCTFATLQPKQDCIKYPADKAGIQLEHLRHYFPQQWKINHSSPIDSSWLVPNAGAVVFSS